MKFAPSVLIDGKTYVPQGWMWILAFAIKGIPWAVEEISKNNYALEKQIKNHLINWEINALEEEKKELEEQLIVVFNKIRSYQDKVIK